MALGANGSFVFSYKSKAGTVQVTSNKIPTPLSEWLYLKDASGQCKRDFSRLRCSLGPAVNSSAYYISDGKNFSWGNLPAGLTTAIGKLIKDRKFVDEPKIVTLGVSGDFFLSTNNGSANWSLGSYAEIGKEIGTIGEGGNIGKIANFSLSPHVANTMAIVLTTGFSASSGLPVAHNAELELMAKAIQEDTDTAVHEKKKGELLKTKREIELLNMATRLADQQTRFSMRQSDYINVCGIFLC
ncbi:hypothetical protein ACEPPN_019458 [Leptodophora sp. 'Broadleaf-Isolate-01']